MNCTSHLKLYNLFLVVLSGSALAEELEFNRDIRPILSENCFHCHGPDKETREAKLRLDTREGALKKDAIIPGNPKGSELMYRITTDDEDDLMPPPGHHLELTKKDIATLEQWIREGAEYQQHWAFEKPAATGSGDLSKIIDTEIQKKLKKEGLKPSLVANHEALIRRLSLDLRGLPPTLAEIDTFIADKSPNAYEKFVDRMLSSPQTAERLALDWLDVARFSDTNGYSIDDHRDMWGWRDWVIHAFMNNKRYDAFLTEQLAGDLIPNATPEQLMATGFLRNSMNTHEGGTIAEEYRVAYIADKIDTVSSTFMGLTMKCAQCHNHKYDPISQKDYYRFYAFFNSATENGKGATNGNTAPFIQVTSPLHKISDAHKALTERGNRIRELRDQLKNIDPEKFESWKAGILAKAGPAEKKPTQSGFRFPDKGREAEWIWAEKTGVTERILVRTTINIDKELKAAHVFFTCDNSADLYVNGKKLAHVDPWMEPKSVNITAHLTKGRNIIGADARNAGGVAGLIAWLQLDYKDGKTSHLVTSPDWQWKAPDSKDLATHFASEDGWKIPVSIGKHGVTPWGRLKAPGAAPPEHHLATILRKAPESLTIEENKILNDKFLKQSSALTKRFHKSLGVELNVLEKRIKDAGKTTVMVMDSPGKRKTHILMRGEYNNPGEEVTAGVPEMFAQLPDEQPANRLALARWLTSPDHPLTARVAVNRYWQLIFGTGLVRTAEDFGSQGEWPSHHTLLDTLAVRFLEGGWDVRELLKQMVMSDTYRQHSDISRQMLEADPQNRLLARAPRTRLPAELVRDNALAISGQLNLQIGGPSVFPEQPDGLWRQISHFGYGTFTAQAYYPDAGEKITRRSMYTFWKRTSPPPSLSIFDAPTRETCTVRRLQTNTPLQALVLLNDPQYVKAAGALARRMIAEGGESTKNRISQAFRLATARLPKTNELEVLIAAYEREKARFTSDPAAARALLKESENTNTGTDPELAALTMIASTILNLNETITKQ